MVPSLRYIKTILANTTNGARWHRMWKAKSRAKGGLVGPWRTVCGGKIELRWERGKVILSKVGELRVSESQ